MRGACPDECAGPALTPASTVPVFPPVGKPEAFMTADTATLPVGTAFLAEEMDEVVHAATALFLPKRMPDRFV